MHQRSEDGNPYKILNSGMGQLLTATFVPQGLDAAQQTVHLGGGQHPPMLIRDLPDCLLPLTAFMGRPNPGAFLMRCMGACACLDCLLC